AEIYTLSLHDALPIYGRLRVGQLDFAHGSRLASRKSPALPQMLSRRHGGLGSDKGRQDPPGAIGRISPLTAHPSQPAAGNRLRRSEEHTSELQSLAYL